MIGIKFVLYCLIFLHAKDPISTAIILLLVPPLVTYLTAQDQINEEAQL
jgi:hypothetical protein